jgi:hypothetical protein
MSMRQPKVVAAFRQNFPDGSVEQTKPTMASEDFGCFGAEWHVPAVFWFFGGDDPKVYDKAKKDGTLNELPTNHNPRFAPVIHPTLGTGVKGSGRRGVCLAGIVNEIFIYGRHFAGPFPEVLDLLGISSSHAAVQQPA